jgi:hypothetical protein
MRTLDPHRGKFLWWIVWLLWWTEYDARSMEDAEVMDVVHMLLVVATSQTAL